jgi:hypothetical protein
MQQIAVGNAIFVAQNAINLQAQNNAILQIYNLNGKLQKTLNFKNGVYNIPLSDLPKGVYVAKAVFGSEVKMVKLAVR